MGQHNSCRVKGFSDESVHNIHHMQKLKQMYAAKMKITINLKVWGTRQTDKTMRMTTDETTKHDMTHEEEIKRINDKKIHIEKRGR